MFVVVMSLSCGVTRIVVPDDMACHMVGKDNVEHAKGSHDRRCPVKRLARTMELTLQQAATQLGKSLRQVRYMVKLGKLPARKTGAVWRIDSAVLTPSPAQVEAALKTQQKLRAAVEDALDGGDTPNKARYSLRNIRAISVAVPLHRACLEELGATHRATGASYSLLEDLARGCHRFAHAEKVEAYRAARDETSRCACALLVDASPRAHALLAQLEQELLPAIAGLLRRYERRPRP